MTEYRFRKRIKFFVFLFLGVVLVGYVLFQSRNLILGPSLTIATPEDGTRIESPVVTIKGTAKNIAFISLNDRQIFVDDIGLFEDKIIVSPGYNILTLEAKDRFGRNIKKTLHLLYSPLSESAATAKAALEKSLP